MSNILKYIPQFIDASSSLIGKLGVTNNRVSSTGDLLESYIKDVISGTLGE